MKNDERLPARGAHATTNTTTVTLPKPDAYSCECHVAEFYDPEISVETMHRWDVQRREQQLSQLMRDHDSPGSVVDWLRETTLTLLRLEVDRTREELKAL